MTRNIFLQAVLVCCFAIPLHAENLIVHEWGTFTSLQNEAGQTMRGIAEDIETLPVFVRDLVQGSGGKGIPAALYPEVSMRLETPVVYFHLPKNSPPITLDFSATFNGGLISQFYPGAEANFRSDKIPALTPTTVGTLTWQRITVGTDKPGPQTNSRIWLAPRKVNAANITARSGESERYLFYRGVAQLDAPLRVVRDDRRLYIIPQAALKPNIPGSTSIPAMWYFSTDLAGHCVYRTLPGIDLRGATPLTTDADFAAGDLRSNDVQSLKADMKKALISAGLFDDEAQAMLETWDEAYFKSPGTRLFFVVPDAWVTQHLPIRVSEPAEIKRVMIGRIDLIAPQQRELAAQYRRIPNDAAHSPDRMEIINALGRFATVILRDSDQPISPFGAAQ
jgi:hypothetical protein